ncbi:MAG TPA: hypothetical protein VF768_02870, partial [Holophagaceae bacterium]
IGDVVARLLGEASPAPVPDGPELAVEAAPERPEPPTLTLTDLEGADAEILDKTLVETPAELPEAKPAAPVEFPPEITETTLSGYASARDAIEKLFGDTPTRSGVARSSGSGSAMDVEATLSALEQTLGGVTPPAAAPEPPAPSEAPSTSTVRFSREEVLAAMAGTDAPKAAAEPTVTLRPQDLLSPAPEAVQQAASARTLVTGPLAIPSPSSADTDLLRLKIGEDLYPGLTLSQVVQWVEEGRVLEGHLVARQFSENWLEAYKVPSLRPVFDRLRRERATPQAASMEELPPPPLETAPMKKGLFGGLFGGKN